MLSGRIPFREFLIAAAFISFLSGCHTFRSDSGTLESIKQADKAFVEHDYEKAASLYRTVLHENEFENGEPTTKFYILDKLASCYIEMGNNLDAKTAYDMKLDIVRRPGFRDLELAALVYEQVGTFNASIGRCDEARDLFLSAIEIRRRAGHAEPVLKESLFTFKSILQIKNCNAEL